MNLLIAFLFALMVIYRLSPDNNAATNSILDVGIVGSSILILLYNLARLSEKHWAAILIGGFVFMGIVAAVALLVFGRAYLAAGG